MLKHDWSYGDLRPARKSMGRVALLEAVVMVLLALAVLVLLTGCASPQADQETSSGWTDAQQMNVTVNFNAAGLPSAAEAVEGDVVPAGRVVLNGTTISIDVSVGSDGKGTSTRGDANADNSPQVEAELPLIP